MIDNDLFITTLILFKLRLLRHDEEFLRQTPLVSTNDVVKEVAIRLVLKHVCLVVVSQKHLQEAYFVTPHLGREIRMRRSLLNGTYKITTSDAHARTPVSQV